MILEYEKCQFLVLGCRNSETFFATLLTNGEMEIT